MESLNNKQLQSQFIAQKCRNQIVNNEAIRILTLGGASNDDKTFLIKISSLEFENFLYCGIITRRFIVKESISRNIECVIC